MSTSKFKPMFGFQLWPNAPNLMSIYIIYDSIGLISIHIIYDSIGLISRGLLGDTSANFFNGENKETKHARACHMPDAFWSIIIIATHHHLLDWYIYIYEHMTKLWTFWCRGSTLHVGFNVMLINAIFILYKKNINYKFKLCNTSFTQFHTIQRNI